MSVSPPDNNSNTQYFNIADVQVIQNAAAADYEGRLERQRQMAEYEIAQREIQARANIELARQQAAELLEMQEASHRATLSQHQSEAIAGVNYVIHEASTAIHREVGAKINQNMMINKKLKIQQDQDVDHQQNRNQKMEPMIPQDPEEGHQH